jgi:hypothetical protein
MTDPAVERDLGAILAARDPGAPPDRLEAVVRERIAADGTRRLWPAALRWGMGTVALVAIAALVVALGSARWSGLMDPGVGATPSPVAAFDPTANGAGIVERPGDVPTSLLVAAALVAAAAIAARRVAGRWVRSGLILLAGVGALVAYGIGTAPFVDFHDGVFQYGAGWVETPIGQSDESDLPGGRQRFEVGPDGILTFGFDLHNRGPVSLTVVGLTPQVGMAWGAFSAVGLARNPDVVDIRDPATTRAFVPTEVGPDQRLFLLVAGRASACALPPGSPPDPNGAGAVIGSVDVVYGILGVRRVSTVQLPFVGELAMDGDCMTSR